MEKVWIGQALDESFCQRRVKRGRLSVW